MAEVTPDDVVAAFAAEREASGESPWIATGYPPEIRVDGVICAVRIAAFRNACLEAREIKTDG